MLDTRQKKKKVFNPESSPERYWPGPKSQEVGGERARLYLSLQLDVTTRMILHVLHTYVTTPYSNSLQIC